MSASLTAPGRVAHSVHVYYVRAGDARKPVDLHVDVARDGGTLSTRTITARQDGQILLEALASLTCHSSRWTTNSQCPTSPVPIRWRRCTSNWPCTRTNWTVIGSRLGLSNCATSTPRHGLPSTCPSRATVANVVARQRICSE